MQEVSKDPGTDEVNGHPHYELFAGLRHICRDMQVLHVGFEQTNELFKVLDNVPHDKPLDVATLCSIDCLRRILPFRTFDEYIERAVWALTSAEREIHGALEGEDKIQIEDRLQRLVEEANGLRQHSEKLRKIMTTVREPYLIRQANLIALWLKCRPIVVQIADLLATTTPEGVGQEDYDRLKKHVSLLRGILVALEKWRDNPSQKMAKGVARCYANWTCTYQDLCAMRDTAELQCRRSGLRYMGRFGFKITEAESRRLQLPYNTPIK